MPMTLLYAMFSSTTRATRDAPLPPGGGDEFGGPELVLRMPPQPMEPMKMTKSRQSPGAVDRMSGLDCRELLRVCRKRETPLTQVSTKDFVYF